jgi:leucyl-tRNA synthetase
MDIVGDELVGAGNVARLFCALCFASDHSRSTCLLVVPDATVLVTDAEEAEEEEEDPKELVFEDGAGDDVDALPVVEAEGFALAVNIVEAKEEEEDPEELVFESDASGDVDAVPAVEADGFIPLQVGR